MKKLHAIGATAIATAAISWMSFSAAFAQAPKDFYQGKTIQLYVGFGTGGAYDAYARLIARHLGKHMPGNPNVVPTNMPGAGSLRLANWLYNAAPKDGTAIATVSRAAPFEPLVGAGGGAQFDSTAFNWLGSANNETSTCVAWKTSGITTFDQLKQKELVMGGDGPTADGEQFARTMNGLFGTKIRIVTGYSGGNDINLAMERGEVQGRCGWSWASLKSTHSDWLKSGDAKVIVQIGGEKHPDLPDVPLLSDMATTEEEKAVLRLVVARQPLGRPYMAPPGVPKDRVEALRAAFMATMQDPEFIAEAERAQLEVSPLSGEKVEALVKDVYQNTPPNAVERTKQLLSSK
jgi:tripartite-type tricarboxylate transporter receptor subunit TctC